MNLADLRLAQSWIAAFPETILRLGDSGAYMTAELMEIYERLKRERLKRDRSLKAPQGDPGD